MAQGLLLGLDIGTTRIKAVALDAAGSEQAGASVATPFVGSATGVDMEVAALGRALAAVIAALGPAREQLAAVGVAGMAESGAPLRDGRALAPIIAWHDGRGEETVASLERRFGPALARWTGRRVRTVSSVAKLGWLVDHGLPEPDRWLGVPELALFLLTGAEATEHSLAARTGAYHVIEHRFLPEVIAHILATTDAGRGAGVFPPVRTAGEAMGFVSGDAAAEFGLRAGIPVTVAGHDHLAAAAGLGARPDDLLNSVGTAETLVRRLDSAPEVERALELDLAVTVWPGGEAWAVLASATRAGLVIEALAAHLGMDPASLDPLAGPPPALLADPLVPGPAPGAGAGAGPPHATSGSGGGAWAAGAESSGARVVASGGEGLSELVALGQGIEVPEGSAGEMWMATLEALAGRTAAAAERVAGLAGPHGRLVVFGGGSRSPAWLRAKAAAFDVPVVGCPVAEAAARGAALAAGVAAGWWRTPSAGPTPLGPPGAPASGLGVGVDAGGGRARTMGPS